MDRRRQSGERSRSIAELSGRGIDRVSACRATDEIILDMDSNVSPTHGDQEESMWNGQCGDLERSALRPSKVHSADGWEHVLAPVVDRYRGTVKRIAFRGDAAFAQPSMYEYFESEGISTRSAFPPIRFSKQGEALASLKSHAMNRILMLILAVLIVVPAAAGADDEHTNLVLLNDTNHYIYVDTVLGVVRHWGLTAPHKSLDLNLEVPRYWNKFLHVYVYIKKYDTEDAKETICSASKMLHYGLNADKKARTDVVHFDGHNCWISPQ